MVSDMLRRELDSRFLNSTPNLGSLLPPPALSAIPGPAKLLDPSMYRPMMPPMGHGLPGLNPSPYPSHSVGYATSAAPPSMTVSSVTGQSSSSGGILSNLGGMSIPSAAPNLSLPSKTVLLIFKVLLINDDNSTVSVDTLGRSLVNGMRCTCESPARSI